MMGVAAWTQAIRQAFGKHQQADPGPAIWWPRSISAPPSQPAQSDPPWVELGQAWLRQLGGAP